ncbi:MAG: type II toxin-antitoxin system RelE/ParE family toxin [Hyphomicrobiaceae bacterium]|nr:type II toxin-antitoxin system RelE/ParE family toxin [Hyphomicrobiaceae bacterium]
MIKKWYDDQTASVQAAMDAVKEYLEQRPREQWRRPEFDKLSGRYSDLGEFRFKVGNVEYRPLGFFGPSRADFTILIGASKKGRNYTPKDALETALKRRKEVLGDMSRSKPYEL